MKKCIQKRIQRHNGKEHNAAVTARRPGRKVKNVINKWDVIIQVNGEYSFAGKLTEEHITELLKAAEDMEKEDTKKPDVTDEEIPW